MGNLADELDQLDDDEYVEEEESVTETTVETLEDSETQPSSVDGARDSGIDVSYSSKKSSPRVRNFSKPFGIQQKPPDEEQAEEEKLSPELEDAMNAIARMTSYTSTSEDPLIPRTIALLQDLGNQTGLEASTQRLTTSTNSMAAHLLAQGKSLQARMASFYSPFKLSAPIDTELVEETVPLADALLKDLPLPDPLPLQGLQKLDRDTTNVIQALSHLTDTLQMGRHTTNAASRHLRSTQTIVADLRRERERAEVARYELADSGWNERIRDRWCAGQCKDIMRGFEDKCDALRQTLVEAGGATA